MIMDNEENKPPEGSTEPEQLEVEAQGEPEPAVGRPENPVTRLPPWKGAYDRMVEQQLLVAGVVIPESFFAPLLGPRLTRQYGENINMLTTQVEHLHGLHLCQRNGDYLIIRIERNYRHIVTVDNKIARRIARNKRFGEAVLREHGHILSDSDKRKIQRRNERNGSLLLFHCKPDEAVKALKDLNEEVVKKMEKKAAKLLELSDSPSANSGDIDTED